MKKILLILIAIIYMSLTACSDKTQEKQERWYNKSQVKLGAMIYKNKCISCHKIDATGSINWKARLKDGSYPPPPLNGDAHTWHHSFDSLKKTIKTGGVGFGGSMPAFGTQLSDEEIESVVAFLQDKWDDRIYKAWTRISGIKKEQ